MPDIDTVDLSTPEYRTQVHKDLTEGATDWEADPEKSDDERQGASMMLDWLYTNKPAKVGEWSAVQWATVEEFHRILFGEPSKASGAADETEEPQIPEIADDAAGETE